MTWHDLALYLIARHVGTTAAQAVARLFALQWHQDGLASYMVFEGRKDHGDAAVRAAQAWVAVNFATPKPLDDMLRRAGLTGRPFYRRFPTPTGASPPPA